MRPRRYVAQQWLALMRPVMRYSYSRDAFVLRGVGRALGPVLRPDRRVGPACPIDGIERRRTGVA